MKKKLEGKVAVVTGGPAALGWRRPSSFMQKARALSWREQLRRRSRTHAWEIVERGHEAPRHLLHKRFGEVV